MNKRCQDIIKKIIYLNIATVTSDGGPWNTPVYYAYDDKYNFYWVSSKDSVHSQNIRPDGRVFLTVYDSTVPEGTGSGVYIEARAVELNDEKEIEKAISVMGNRANKTLGDTREFLGQFPRRVYKATPEKIWTNDSKEINGHHVDVLVEVYEDD